MAEKPRPRPAKGADDLASRIDRLEAALGDAKAYPGADPGGPTATSSDLERRIAAIERALLGRKDGDKPTDDEDAALRVCAVPYTPPRVFAPGVSADRARLILAIGKKWVNGTKLRYCFMDANSPIGGVAQKALVRDGFARWKGIGIGITFEEVQDVGAADVRIGFVEGDGAWSYVGRDVRDIPGRFERTMNFGWDLTEDPRKADVAVHEIGHTLGFPHEHQNPFAGIVWDEEAVYRYFGGQPNNWDRATTEFNILRKLSAAEVQGSQWDPESIMHYAFGPGLIQQPPQYRGGLRPSGGLSSRDVAQAKVFYPPGVDDGGNPELKPFRSQTLTLAPAQQANFAILPTVTRMYTIQTFGGSDTLMVLFEDQGGDLRFVKGDDDSGTDLNCRVEVRLAAGRRYVLRIRLYSNVDTGETAVMMW